MTAAMLLAMVLHSWLGACLRLRLWRRLRRRCCCCCCGRTGSAEALEMEAYEQATADDSDAAAESSF